MLIETYILIWYYAYFFNLYSVKSHSISNIAIILSIDFPFINLLRIAHAVSKIGNAKIIIGATIITAV